jgi:hypothetical protein
MVQTGGMVLPYEFLPTSGLAPLLVSAGVYVASGDKVDHSSYTLTGGVIIDPVDSQQYADLATSLYLDPDPLYIFGYSQGAVVASLAEQQLADYGIPQNDLHFVLVGDSASADGGFLNTFIDSLPESWRQLTIDTLAAFGVGNVFGVVTPDNLYPTTVYSLSGDGWTNWDNGANALGMFTDHLEYRGLTPDEVGSATLTLADHLIDYYTINSAAVDSFTALWNALEWRSAFSEQAGELLVVEGDDFAAVDRHPVPRLQVRPEGFGYPLLVRRCLRPLQLVEVRKLRPRGDGMPQPHGRLTGGWIDEDRPEQTLPVGEEQGRHSVAVGVDHPLMLGHHLVAGRRVIDRLVDEIGVEAEFFEQVPGDRLLVRLAAFDVQGAAGPPVPRIQVGHGPAP